MTSTIRIELPYSLSALAGIGREVRVCLTAAPTQRSLLDALEAAYPVLQGTLRDHVTKQRRPYVRFFACEQDLSHCPPDEPLPAPVATGKAVFIVVGAIVGG